MSVTQNTQNKPSPPPTTTTTGGKVATLQRSTTAKAVAAAEDMTRRMICGGLAGMIAKTATNPLERIKMLSQTGEHGLTSTNSGASKATSSARKPISVIQLYRTIIKNEGIIGLWAGNGANLLRVFPAKAIVFSTNDMYQSAFRKLSRTPNQEKLPSVYAFLAGGFAGMTATAMTYPLDFARGRISGKLGKTSGSGGSGRGGKAYHGIIRTVVLTVKDEGFLAVYKGVTPTLLGAMPYEGIKFGTVGIMDKLFPINDEDKKASTSKQSAAIRKMIFGGLGGVMAGLITYPNDTIRRMLQLQGSRGTTTQFTGYWDCARKTYKAEGIGRFYHGVTINIIRMAPNAAVQFGSYELLKQWTADYF